MDTHLIEVDDKVFKYLQKHAEPLVDTPNSVITRLLFKDVEDKDLNKRPKISVSGLPKSLAQILEVVSEMEINGYSRLEATRVVAERNDTVPTTVMDKYCRQLNKKAHEIDQILKEPGYHEFIDMLKDKYPNYHGLIGTYFETLTVESDQLDL